MRYFLGGVNGSGKTTLLHKIKEIEPEIATIKGSSALMSFLGFPGDYEALRRVPNSEAVHQVGLLIQSLAKEHQHFIFDAHYLNIVRGEVKRVTGDWIENFDALLLLKASPEVIFERIKKDHGLRDRALFPEKISEDEELKILTDYIQKYEEEFDALKKTHQGGFLVLDGEAESDKVAKQFIEFHKSLLNKHDPQ